MTDPNAAAALRNMKVPENMASSQALKDFLISQSETDPTTTTLDDQLKAHQQLLALLVGSHLEVVNVLGALEETLKIVAAQRPA